MKLLKTRYDPKLTQLEELARRVKAFRVWWKKDASKGYWILRGYGNYIEGKDLNAKTQN